MKNFEYTIKDELGIHARPAGLLVKLVKNFKSNVLIASKGASADARKLMAVMALGITKGTQVTITAEGEDEEAVITEIEKFFRENL
ncbi:HPr family phosphocarrier protein [Anaerocolumna sp. AGMB13020]|uniref:HPr family phosphocarrier protein n=1 Tax=Anaerocolumna sp. AGMB13020 TaxID=3081750 RepID=UPI002954F4D0|nr:HPr family phosphocarrier protein [Anaerocolumna sp. AGMB13020]WOO38637.1 HPr family phosphocarrier protein [Anaerocolumna sp. AGMB13020]